MARTRNWDPRRFAEVFVRLNHEQSISTVARCTGFSYQQIQHFDAQMRAAPDRLPANVRGVDPEDVKQLNIQVAAEIEATRATAALASPDGVTRQGSSQEIEAEVIGCIDLVKQSASQLGISARRFLWLCTTHARSA